MCVCVCVCVCVSVGVCVYVCNKLGCNDNPFEVCEREINWGLMITQLKEGGVCVCIGMWLYVWA